MVEYLLQNYDERFVIDVFSYLNNFEKLGLDLDNIQVLSKKEREVLTKVNNLYRKITLYRDHKVVELNKMDASQVLMMSNLFLTDIFPSKKDEIQKLDKIVVFEDMFFSDTGLFYRIIDDKVVFEKLIFSNDCNNYSCCAMAHEKMHALTFSNMNLLDLFQNGLEFLPIFIQKIILYELENEFDCKYLNDLDLIIRINDNMKGYSLLLYSEYLKRNPSKYEELDKYIINYCRIKTIDYQKAELYSELLLQCYIEDRNLMIERLNNLLDSKITIQNFLDSYNISLLNKDLIPLVKETTNKCKKISIIP